MNAMPGTESLKQARFDTSLPCAGDRKKSNARASDEREDDAPRERGESAKVVESVGWPPVAVGGMTTGAAVSEGRGEVAKKIEGENAP